jgi:hypothetical protein
VVRAKWIVPAVAQPGLKRRFPQSLAVELA